MSRFDSELQAILAHVRGIREHPDALKPDPLPELSEDQKEVKRAVIAIRDMLNAGDSADLIMGWLELESRMKRLFRMIELRVPDVIFENELTWLETRVIQIRYICDGLKPPSLTQEQQEELEQLASYDVLSDEDSLDLVKGALLGLAIGDAMGATTEFMDPQAIRSQYGYIREIQGGGWLDLEPGQTTDDTAMTAAVAEGIIEAPSDPIEAIGRVFLRWQATNPPDIGITIQTAFSAYQGNWAEAARVAHGRLGEKSAGNGSLMRCLPIALAYPNLEKMELITTRHSKMTHYDDLASEGCLIYNRIVHRVLTDHGILGAIVRETEGTRYHGVYLKRPSCSPDGYVVHTLTWVLYWVWNSTTFAEAIQGATNEGGDADTVAAIVGGLEGLVLGYEGVSGKFEIRESERLLELAEQLWRVRLDSMPVIH